MIWLLLAFGISIEVIGSFFLKKANGFQNIQFLALMFICYLISMSTMSQVAKTLPLSTVYPIWTGVGTVLVSLVGVIVFKEVMSGQKIFFVSLIILGVVGLYKI